MTASVLLEQPRNKSDNPIKFVTYLLTACNKAVAKALIGGVYIHIFRFCPTSFFSNKIDFKEVGQAEPEYMNNI